MPVSSFEEKHLIMVSVHGYSLYKIILLHNIMKPMIKIPVFISVIAAVRSKYKDRFQSWSIFLHMVHLVFFQVFSDISWSDGLLITSIH